MLLFLIVFQVLLFFAVTLVEHKPENSAAQAPNNVRQLGNVVLAEDAIYNFLPDVKNTDQNKSNRYFALLEIGERCQKNKHKNQPACAQQHDVFKEDNVDKPCYHRGYCKHGKQVFTAIFFFHYGANHQYKQKIVDIMAEIRMCNYMGKQPKIHQRVQPGGVTYGQKPVEPAACKHVDTQHDE